MSRRFERSALLFLAAVMLYQLGLMHVATNALGMDGSFVSQNVNLKGSAQPQQRKLQMLPQEQDLRSEDTPIVKHVPSPDQIRKHFPVGTVTEEYLRQLLRKAWMKVTAEAHVVIPFFLYRVEPIQDPFAVSVALHADTGRLNRALHVIRRWNGPVSLSVLLTSQDDINALIAFVMQNQSFLLQVDFHIHMEQPGRDYPHNLLRQQALDAVETNYFLPLDADFVTPLNAGQEMPKLLSRDPALREALQNRVWMVLPAFERRLRLEIDDTNIESLTTKFPNPVDREEAKYMWDVGIMEPFHLTKFKWGHQMTKFGQWYHWTIHRKTIPESFFPTDYEPGFEPYFLGYKNKTTVLPEYWPDFRGFGYNKYVYFLEADQMGFQFGVLRDFFVVHLPHHNPPKRLMSEETIQEVERFSEYLMKTYNMTENQVYNSLH